MNMNFQTYRPRSRRSAFTLVELLLVIAIIAILASLGVGVMAQAQNDAAVAATRSRINIIKKILEIELEDYEIRRSPVSVGELSVLIDNSTLVDSAGRKLLHAKNLKRMIIADLIRTEMPDGSRSGDQTIGRFPSQALSEYLSAVGIGTVANTHGSRYASSVAQREFTISAGTAFATRSAPTSVLRWNDWLREWLNPAAPASLTAADLEAWPLVEDFSPTDEVFEEATRRSELLYEILQNIDVDGVPATDVIGASSIADTDGNGFNEIVDAWGEPMFLQWQQERIFLEGAPLIGSTTPQKQNNIWVSGAGMAGLSREHESFAGTYSDYCGPVLPTQIRPFLTSERLQKIDGFSADYLTDFKFF